MHASLNVDEIIRLIACELVASGTWASAVALACCCKNFEDPVLDVLWGGHDRPILESLPGEVWNHAGRLVSDSPAYVPPSLNSSVWKALETLRTTPEWTRFRKNARRVRRITGSAPIDLLPDETLEDLEFRALDEPLFPNLKTLTLWHVTEGFIPFIPLFLSTRIIGINISFMLSPHHREPLIVSVITALSTLCPNLHYIRLISLPRCLTITSAVSGMFLANNRSTLRSIHVDSPLTEEAREVVHNLPDLQELLVVVERDASLPSLVLPNLSYLSIECGLGGDWTQMFRGAVFGNLEAVTFESGSESMGGFLEEFENVALAASIQDTLSEFYVRTRHSWSPNYPSLLPFVQMVNLIIEFSCGDDCSSNVDDDVVTKLAQAMPNLETLHLGRAPCYEPPTGVTVKGLAVLAHRCPDLYSLCVHFQVESLSDPPVTEGVVPDAESPTPRRDCALRELYVGEIEIATEELVLVVALTLARIFPNIETVVESIDEDWGKVMDAICLSRKIVDHSSMEHPFVILEDTLMTLTSPQEPHSRTVVVEAGERTSTTRFTTLWRDINCSVSSVSPSLDLCRI